MTRYSCAPGDGSPWFRPDFGRGAGAGSSPPWHWLSR